MKRLLAYFLFIGIAGITLAVPLVLRGPFPDLRTTCVYTALGLLGYNIVVVYPSGNRLLPGDPLTMAALWCYGTPLAVFVIVPSMLLHFITKRHALANCLFNGGQFVMTLLAAGTVRALASQQSIGLASPAQIPSIFLMVLVFDLVNNLFVAVAMAMNSETPYWEAFYRMAYEERRSFLVQWYLINMSAIYVVLHTGLPGVVLAFTGIVALWSELRFQNDFTRKAEQARTDTLTGVFNLRYLEDWLNDDFPKIACQDSPCSFIFVDVDGLKQVNDTLGHDAGDAVLVHLASVLTANARKEDRVVRYGGDEFVVICKETDADLAGAQAFKMIKAYERSPLIHDGVRIAYGASFGVASFPKHSIEGRDLVRLADKAMYLAKKHGGNRVYTADSL
jgi:diguanylate cyclase (GGDEF)-like protein